jgi:C1A family cysteine protease
MFGVLDYFYSYLFGVTEKPIIIDNSSENATNLLSTNTELSKVIQTNFINKYGWKKGDAYTITPKHIFQVLSNLINIQNVDLRSSCPDVYDQGHLGSCTANAIGFCYHFDEIKQKEVSTFIPSRLFIYYNERNLEGHVSEDSGAEIHDGIQVIHSIGVCSETDWPYNIDKFKDKPTENCYNLAQSHKTIDYRAISQNLDQLKSALVEGFPVVFGFSVYESFESEEVAKTGNMPIPKPDEKLLGGHAVALVGFDNTKKVFIVRNSWGSGWGDKGYFYMPYEFIVNPNMASDFWTVTKTVDDGDNHLLNKKITLENHLKTKLIYDKILSNKKVMNDFSQNYTELSNNIATAYDNLHNIDCAKLQYAEQNNNDNLILVSKRNRRIKLKNC